MKIKMVNVNTKSNSGPNSFARKLAKYMSRAGHSFAEVDYDTALCFIQDPENTPSEKLFQRLDGIYFNSAFDYKLQNKGILDTYRRAKGVIFQSEFNKDLTFKYFGEHSNYEVIHNGADVAKIDNLREHYKNSPHYDRSSGRSKWMDKYDNLWMCASSWRPHKRLDENIRYYMEHRGPRDCLLVAGDTPKLVNEPDVIYLGTRSPELLIRLYMDSKYFIHLAWLDHCPNVVVDARAAGCQIICSSAGGTREIAGLDAIVLEESAWDFEPTELYSPPKLDFSKKVKNNFDSCYNMKNVAEKYVRFMNASYS